jgi:hypothetical protein
MVQPWQTAAESPSDEGVDVTGLETGTTVSVYTRNTHYRITVLNGSTGAVVMQGGLHFPTPTYVRLQSCATLDEPAQVGFIGVGRRLQIVDGVRQVVTSPVQSIVVEDIALSQRAFWRIA